MFAVAERPTGRIVQVRPHLRVVDLPRLGSRRRRRNGKTHNDQSDLAHDFPPQMSDIVDRLHCTVTSCRHPPADRPDGCPGSGVSRGRRSRQSCRPSRRQTRSACHPIGIAQRKSQVSFPARHNRLSARASRNSLMRSPVSMRLGFQCSKFLLLTNSLSNNLAAHREPMSSFCLGLLTGLARCYNTFSQIQGSRSHGESIPGPSSPAKV